MAENTKRSDLIRRQLENLLTNAPQPYSEEQAKQIMKGRRKQADIDAGRATINKRLEEIQQYNQQIERLNEQLGTAETDERTAGRQDIENATKQRYNEESSSGWGRGAQLGANAAALPLGFAAGRISGKGVNLAADLSQGRKNARLGGVAEDRLRGVTTRRGAIAAAERSGAMPSNNAFMRVGGRMLPHLIGGAGGIAKGSSMLSNSYQGDDFYADMTNRGMGLGLIGGGVGLVQEGGRYSVNPGTPPDARSIAIIESEGLRRGNAAPPPPSGPKPGSLAALKAEARDLQIPGRSKLRTVGALQSAIDSARKGAKALPKSGVLAPLTAAATAYQATRNPAEAGQEGGSRGEAATNAALAGGTAAGTAGLVQRYAPRVLGALGRMSGPLGLAEGAGEVQKRLNQPGATAGGVVGDMYQEGFGNATDDFGAAMADFMKFLAEGQGPDQSAGPYTP